MQEAKNKESVSSMFGRDLSKKENGRGIHSKVKSLQDYIDILGLLSFLEDIGYVSS